MTAALMFQGTGSDVGKSLLVAGLCRAYARRGLKVVPFKPQNMSNNAAIAEGGEIGRAQALQARAAGVAPTVDMNPVLLKPQSETGAQLVLRGRVLGSADAARYRDIKATLLPSVLESFNRLAADADLVLVEGAGSAAEINLRDGDIANMGFAEAAGIGVVLVGDIDRGGVIAQLVGTWELLRPSERRRVIGFLVNKFRGDPSLFESGMAMIVDRTGMAALGLVPWFAGARLLPREDSFAVHAPPPRPGASLRVAVPELSRIANFDDLDPLAAEPDVSLNLVPPGRAFPGNADLIVLPGSKATRADLAFLREQGWDVDIAAHVRRGGAVLGICAGFQMLGRSVSDPGGIEGRLGISGGLDLLDVETVLGTVKNLGPVRGRHLATGAAVSGYEMHMGVTAGPALSRPFAVLEGKFDGAVSEDGRIMGSYVHGMFAGDEFRHAFLAALGARGRTGYEGDIEATLNALASHLEHAVNLDALLAAAYMA